VVRMSGDRFLGVLPPDAPKWGPKNKEFRRRWHRRCFVVQGPTQEMPVWEFTGRDRRAWESSKGSGRACGS